MSIKKEIYKAVLEGKYLTDTDIAKLYNGKEPSWNYVSDLKNAAYRLKRDKERFDNVKKAGVEKFRRRYVLHTKYNGSYIISKDYFMEIKSDFLKEVNPKKYMYYYKGNKLYNIESIDWSFVGHDLQANWRDPEESNKEKLGKFYLKELEIKKK